MLNRLVPWLLLPSISALCWAGCGDDSAPAQDTTQPDQPDTSTPVDTYVPPPDVEQPPVCSSFQCVDGVASECGGGLSLECGRFYGQCTTFQGEAGVDGWCNCGRLIEGEAMCLTDSSGVVCDGGLGVPFDCVAGAVCAQDTSGVVGCACDNRSDGVCPDSGCTGDPDCSACTPSCGDRECGGNGCGGSCGSCGLGTTCDGSRCVCKPSCEDKQCGDDGCGGSCGSCQDPMGCSFGQCVMAPPEDLLNGHVLGPRVFGSAVSGAHVYFVTLGMDSRYYLFRCPSTGCTGTPEKVSPDTIGSADRMTVAVAGDEVFWTQGLEQIWRANIAGGALGAPSKAYDGLGAKVVDLDTDGTSLFAVTSTWIGTRTRYWVQIPGNGGAAITDTSTLAFLPTNMQTDITRIDVITGAITVWSGYVGNPQPIHSIGISGTETVSPSTETVGAIVRMGSQIAWTEGDSLGGGVRRLLTCGLGDCATPYVVTMDPAAIATDGNRLYFTKAEGGTHHLMSCDSLDLLIGNCTPTIHSSGYAWTGIYKLHIRDGYAYGGGQMGLVRVRL